MTAKQLNRVRTTALVLLIFLFLLICVYVLSGAWQRGARYPLYRLSSPYEIGMNYEQQTGENSPASLSRHANFKGDFREQRYFLPEDDIPAPALRIYTADAILDVSMNGKELLSYGTPQLEAYSFVPGGYHLVTLPEDSAGAELTIRYTATALHTELFPGTPLLEEAQRGEFTPLSEKDMLIELKTFVENLTCDCTFITHHTVSGQNLTGPNFLQRKDQIIAALDHEIRHGDMDRMAAIRRNKRSL